MENSNYVHSDITKEIIKCFYLVYNKLGYGFLEKVYERSLMIELDRQNISYVSQPSFKVYYDGNIVGKYTPDLLIEDKVVVELKAAITIHPTHEDQLRNALRATDMEVGLLLNFGIIPQLKRKVFANEFKPRMNNDV